MLPFEVLSVLLLAALVGAIVLSRPDIGGTADRGGGRPLMHAGHPVRHRRACCSGSGVYGVLRRRNAVLVLMAVELMLNAVNLILVTADATVRAALPHAGQVFALFVIVLAAAEVGRRAGHRAAALPAAARSVARRRGAAGRLPRPAPATSTRRRRSCVTGPAVPLASGR